MLPRDWTGDDPAEAKAYLAALKKWKEDNAALVAAQAAARAALDAADDRLAAVSGWLDQLQVPATSIAARQVPYDALGSDIANSTAQVAHDDALIAGYRQAFAVATSRLLGDISLRTPVALLPLRIETHWATDELQVRIYPDEIGVDTHDERLTPSERRAGEAYWAKVGTPVRDDQAWQDLVRQTGAARAAWVARATRNGQPPPRTRESGWDFVAAARLLPDRFAVIALSDQRMRSVSLAGPHVTWGEPVPADLDLDPLTATGWLTDFAAAEKAGMAVRLPIDPGAAPIETLLVVGIRSQVADLAGLISGHAFSAGLEILADGTPTNNSADLRSGLDPTARSRAARGLIDPVALDAGAAGVDLATALGVPAATFAGVGGADVARNAVVGALVRLVGDGTSGALREALGVAGAAWPITSAAGPSPSLRIGRQPYGVLPTSSPRDWVAGAAAHGAPLTTALHAWAAATGPQSDLDPLALPAPPVSGTPRGAEAFAEVAIESPASIAWTATGSSYAGLDTLVGPDAGVESPSSYLTRIADTDLAGLGALRSQLTSLLAQVAIGAKQSTTDPAGIDAALRGLSTVERALLGQLFSATLDAASHRFDAWVVGAVSERLGSLRTAAPPTIVGAVGWLTDLRPATGRRSEGHILAPSLAHAATAAVMRAGYLAEVAANGRSDGSRQPMAVDLSSARVRAAKATLVAVRAGQPLAAVLGRQFEDDLVASGLQVYLATFRKLTRFRTGSALEALEDARHTAERALADDQANLIQLRAVAEASRTVAASAAAALASAQQEQATAQAAATPYLTMQARQASLATTLIPQLTAALATIDAQRPTPGSQNHGIVVPDP